MLRATLLTITGLAALVASAQTRDVHRTVALSPTGSVTIENHKGSIHVTTWNRAEVEIAAVIEAEPGSEMDRRLFERTDVQIDSSTNSVDVRTRYPETFCCSDDNGTNPQVRYTIHMPKTARLTVRDHRSETEISDLDGALDLRTHRGTARVHGLRGALTIDTHRGDIKVDFAAFTGDSHITTHRGTIDLGLPSNSRFELQAEMGRHGSIESSFAMTSRVSERRSEKLSGVVNGGGPRLKVNSERGELRLRSL